MAPYVNQLNWKTHPARQLAYLTDSIKGDHGWVGPGVLFCSNTMRILDGHGRLQLSLDAKLKSIPIDVGWWSLEHGDEILAGYDTTGSMASVDGNALASLTELNLKRIVERSKGKNSQQLTKAKMNGDINSFAKQILKEKKNRINIRKADRKLDKKLYVPPELNGEQKPPEKIELYDKLVREDHIFPSSGNDLGIPDLLQKMLYSNTRILPTDTFDRTGRSLEDRFYYCQSARPFDSNYHMKPIGGFLGFFTEDERFEKYYNDPAKNMETLKREEWFAVLEPDYSTYTDWPYAKRLWSVYRARWCARFWQEHGIKVIPLLYNTEDLEANKWMYDSLPASVPIAAMQLRMSGKKDINSETVWGQAGEIIDYVCQTKNLKHILFHAAPNYKKYILGKIPTSLKYTFVTPFIDKRRIAMKDNKEKFAKASKIVS